MDLFRNYGKFEEKIIKNFHEIENQNKEIYFEKLDFGKRQINIDFTASDLKNILIHLNENDLIYPYFESFSLENCKISGRLYTIHGKQSTEESQAQSTLYSMKLQTFLEENHFLPWIYRKIPQILLFQQKTRRKSTFQKREETDLPLIGKQFYQEEISQFLSQFPLTWDLLNSSQESLLGISPSFFEAYSLKKCFFHVSKTLQTQTSNKMKERNPEKASIRYTRDGRNSTSPDRPSPKISLSSNPPNFVKTSKSRSKQKKKQSVNLQKKVNKNHFKIDLSQIKARRSHGVNSDRPIYGNAKYEMEKKKYLKKLNYTHRENFPRGKGEMKSLSIVKVLKKAFNKKTQNNKFAWLVKNPDSNIKKDKFGKKKMSKEEALYINYQKQARAKEIPEYLNRQKKKNSLPVPRNTMRTQEDIIIKIEDFKRINQGDHFKVSELIEEPLTERNPNIQSNSRDHKRKDLLFEPPDSGCQSDRSHLKKKSLFSKLANPYPMKTSKYKKMFTFKEELFESKNINSFGSSGDILSKVRISFAPNEEPKPKKTSILETKISPIEVGFQKPSFVEYSTPSGSKNDKNSFDLKLDLHSLKDKGFGAKSERDPHPKAKGFDPHSKGLDFIPERSSEHNFEGKFSRMGRNCLSF